MVQVKFKDFFYTISLSLAEQRLEPTFLKEYFLSANSFIPKGVVNSKMYALKGSYLEGGHKVEITSEYPYYYILNEFLFNLNGKLVKTTKTPNTYKGFSHNVFFIEVADIITFPSPGDELYISNTNELNILGYEFSFNYDFATKKMVFNYFVPKS